MEQHRSTMPPLVRISDLENQSRSDDALLEHKLANQMYISSEASYKLSDSEADEEEEGEEAEKNYASDDANDDAAEPSSMNSIGAQMECPPLEHIGMPYGKGAKKCAKIVSPAKPVNAPGACAVGPMVTPGVLSGSVHSSLSYEQRRQMKWAKRSRAPRQYCGFPLFYKVITAVGEGHITEIGDEIFVSHGAEQSFHTGVMGYDAAKLDESAVMAQEFFFREFGFDFRALPWTTKSGTRMKMKNDAVLIPFFLNPLLEYRIYNISSSEPGVMQPQGSHPVQMGGWAVRILDKNGFRFDPTNSQFGRREGKNTATYPCGTMLLHGDIKIEQLAEQRVERMERNPADPCAPPVKVYDTKVYKNPAMRFTMTFASRTPFIATPDLIMPLDLSLMNASLGRGALQGMIRVTAPADRAISCKHRVEISTVLKFPDFIANECI